MTNIVRACSLLTFVFVLGAVVSTPSVARAETEQDFVQRLHPLQLRAPFENAESASVEHSGRALHLLAPELQFDSVRLSELILPNDTGGGAGTVLQGGFRPVVCLLIGLFVGFGIGHLIAGDRQGFILWLIIDVVAIVALIVIYTLLPGIVGLLATVGFVVERVIQGIDAYGSAGGQRIVERSYDGAMFARESVERGTRFQPVVRTMSFAFGP